MPALKLPVSASIYGGKPSNLHKLLSTRTTATTFEFTATVSTSAITRIPNCSLAWRPRWRITPCEPLAPSALDKLSSPCRNLGLRGQKYFYSSEEKEIFGEGGESGVSFGTDMGPPNKGDQWFDSDLSVAPPLSSHIHRQKPPPPPHQQQQSAAKLLTLPTILTIGRVAAVPLLVGTFYVDRWWAPTATTCIFITAAVTDWLDGFLARRMKLGTAFGAFLDPVADKLMVAATLVLLCTRPFEAATFGHLPWVLTIPSIAIIGREITMSAVREWAASQNSKLSEAVAVNNLGKWKTATQMIALTILLAARDSSLTGAGSLVAFGVFLLYISAWLAVWSLVVYMRKIWKVLLM